MTREQAGELVKVILGAFPTQRLRMTAVDVAAMVLTYTAGLIDLDVAVARAAVDRCNKTSEWIPTIAKIRAEAAELQAGDARGGEEAWGDVIAEVRRVGVYGMPQLADPRALEAVRLVGWRRICMRFEDDASAPKAFIAAYDRIEDRARKAAILSPGAGGGTPARALPGPGPAPRRSGDVSSIPAQRSGPVSVAALVADTIAATTHKKDGTGS